MPYRSLVSLRRLWVSVFDSCDYSTVNKEDDTETQCVVLLAHSLVTIFKRIRKEQKIAMGELDVVKQELKYKQRYYESSQVELKSARVELKAVQVELKAAQVELKAAQQKCGTLKEELARLQAVKPLSQNCSKCESQSARMQEHVNNFNVAKIGPQALLAPSLLRTPEPLSPDVIEKTPEAASPDIIENTPQPPKRDIRLKRPVLCKKKAMKTVLRISPPSNEEDLPVVDYSILALNTEDIDASVKIDPVLEENVIIPASFIEISSQKTSHGNVTFCGTDCASTAKENLISVTSSTNSKSAETQFNPVCATGKLWRDIPGDSSRTPFDLPLASTAHGITQNPELEALVHTQDTGHDGLLLKGQIRPEYAHRRDAVRSENDRKQLPGWDC